MVLVAASFMLVAVASACTSKNTCPDCADIVSSIPWSGSETRTYDLTQDNKPAGTTTLSISKEGDQFVLEQRSEDDQGNSDDARATVDGTTLKPVSSVRTIVDKEQRRVAESTYSDVATSKCGAGRIVNVKQTNYSPPGDTTPDSTRANPLCVPEHAYENDTSLFVWRTITFEKGYTVTYQTVIADRRDTQILTIRVNDKVQRTPRKDEEAWQVDILAQGQSQRAWFATTPDHTLLAYQNGNFLFTLR